MNIYSAQCQPVAESEALWWVARGSRRPAGSSEFQEGDSNESVTLSLLILNVCILQRSVATHYLVKFSRLCASKTSHYQSTFVEDKDEIGVW